jgi:hypothetical protein
MRKLQRNRGVVKSQLDHEREICGGTGKSNRLFPIDVEVLLGIETHRAFMVASGLVRKMCTKIPKTSS